MSPWREMQNTFYFTLYLTVEIINQFESRTIKNVIVIKKDFIIVIDITKKLELKLRWIPNSDTPFNVIINKKRMNEHIETYICLCAEFHQLFELINKYLLIFYKIICIKY